jgi:hypothetical protein
VGFGSASLMSKKAISAGNVFAVRTATT